MRTVCVTILLYQWWISTACADELRSNEAVLGGGSTEVCGFWISSPSLFLRRDHAGVVCGMVQVPGGQREYSFVLLTRGDEKRSQVPVSGSRSSVNGDLARQSSVIELEGKRLEVVYTMNRNGNMETLAINGKPADLKSGRVILADFSGKELKLNQVNAVLPVNPAIPTTRNEIEKHARECASDLKRDYKAVQNFLK